MLEHPSKAAHIHRLRLHDHLTRRSAHEDQPVAWFDAEQVADTATGAATATDTVADAGTDTNNPAAVPWSLFRIDKAAGPCPPGMSCTWWWVLTNDGAITMEIKGQSAINQMTPVDFAAADAILLGSAFATSMVGGSLET